MPDRTNSSKTSPCYCPSCQRLFRTAPAGYLCPHDETPVIDVADPLPISTAWTIVPTVIAFSVVLGIGTQYL